MARLRYLTRSEHARAAARDDRTHHHRPYAQGVAQGQARPLAEEPRTRRRRVLEFRTLNIRRWDRIVEAWAEGDESALDAAQVDQTDPQLSASRPLLEDSLWVPVKPSTSAAVRSGSSRMGVCPAPGSMVTRASGTTR